MPTFSDQNIAKLFGAEAAEDEPEDRFRQYFFFNQTYENLISDLPLRILVGHKGVGKSVFADFGFDWEIHPAYRWALQPQDIQDVIDSLGR